MKSRDDMPAKFVFAAHDLKRGLNMAKLVKPSSGDFVMKFDPARATIYSADKRRMSFIHVVATKSSGIDDAWVSDEYHIPISKMSLFDSDLESVTFTLNENSMVIQASDGKQTRRATIKRRVDSTRRQVIPQFKLGDVSTVDANQFGKLLRVVGCSALVRETKTEEEMRVNQVHFDTDSESAFSNARYHASYASLPGMKLNLSIIGSDIPVIRSFCSKSGSTIGLCQDKTRLYVIDPDTKSMLVFGRVASKKPDFSLPSDNFSTEILLEKEKILDGLDWALTALDGTQRLSCEIEDDVMRMSNNGEIFNVPISIQRGSSFHADLPARFLRAAINHTDSNTVLMKFGHADVPSIMEITDAGPGTGVRHFFQVMRGK